MEDLYDLDHIIGWGAYDLHLHDLYNIPGLDLYSLLNKIMHKIS